jgi:[ribosomal protein S5]-alanine N-acetyltransferase
MPTNPGPALLRRIRLPIQTPRLLLRPPRRSDVPALVPLVADWRVARTTTIPHPHTRRDGYAFIRRTERERRKGTNLALSIRDKTDGRLLGGTGFHQIDWAERRFELGYWVAPPEWGKGIATEAAYAVCREGFRTLRMHRVEAKVFAFNPGSARVLRKVGFRLEARLRKKHRDVTGWVDVLQFGLLADELRPPP